MLPLRNKMPEKNVEKENEPEAGKMPKQKHRSSIMSL